MQCCGEKPSTSSGKTVSFGKCNRRFQKPIPLSLFNDSIDFVQQIHWFCLTIPMESYTETVGFLEVKSRFAAENLAFSVNATACERRATSHLSVLNYLF
jgi:hypothetical protein